MKRYRVLITEPAADDLQEMARYFAKEFREPAIGQRLIGRIKEAVMSLPEMTVRHATVADDRLAALGIRKLLVENHIVFYVVSEKDEAVTVVRILYSRRDWEHLL